jgi:invasion protein IalB
MRMTIAAGGGRPAPVGTLVGPFGVDLAQGVALSVDGAETGRIAFQTCLQIGCIAPLALDEAQVAALRGGQTLVALIRPSDNPTSEISLSFSLMGFGDALGRLQGGAAAAP